MREIDHLHQCVVELLADIEFEQPTLQTRNVLTSSRVSGGHDLDHTPSRLCVASSVGRFEQRNEVHECCSELLSFGDHCLTIYRGRHTTAEACSLNRSGSR